MTMDPKLKQICRCVIILQEAAPVARKNHGPEPVVAWP